jgi:hypothetical protein
MTLPPMRMARPRADPHRGQRPTHEQQPQLRRDLPRRHGRLRVAKRDRHRPRPRSQAGLLPERGERRRCCGRQPGWWRPGAPLDPRRHLVRWYTWAGAAAASAAMGAVAVFVRGHAVARSDVNRSYRLRSLVKLRTGVNVVFLDPLPFPIAHPYYS